MKKGKNPWLRHHQRENEFERLKKLKMDSETVFYKLQAKINAYYKETDTRKTYIVNYRIYIYSLNNQISFFDLLLEKQI